MRLLISIFGQADVRTALKSALTKRAGRRLTILASNKHEVVWALVEARRTAKRCTVKGAAEAISRKGGIRHADGSPPLRTARLIIKAFHDADGSLRRHSLLGESFAAFAQAILIRWRRSGKTYDVWERGLLRDPALLITEKTKAIKKSTARQE